MVDTRICKYATGPCATSDRAFDTNQRHLVALEKEGKRSKAAAAAAAAAGGDNIKPSLLEECIRELESSFGKGAVTTLGGGSAPNPLCPHVHDDDARTRCWVI